MRKGLCLALLLLGMMLPALADNAAPHPHDYVGEWLRVLSIDGNQIHDWQETESFCMDVTVEGYVTYFTPDEVSVPWLIDEDTGRLYFVEPASGTKLFLDSNGRQLKVYPDDLPGAIYFVRNDAAPLKLETVRPAVSLDGTWHARTLISWSMEGNDRHSVVVPIGDLCENPVSITLPAVCDLNTLQQAWTEAISQQPAECAIHALGDLYGYEARNPFTLLLVTRHGLILLDRPYAFPADKFVRQTTREIANFWRLSDVTVGGIPLPESALSIAVDFLIIDQLGYADFSGEVTLLENRDGTLYLGSHPIEYDDEYLYLTVADGVYARYIPEADWYRQQLVGTWQLSRIKVPAIGLEQDVTSAFMDVQLIFEPDGDAIIHTSDGDMCYTLASTDDFTSYRLIAEYGDDQLLNIASLSLLRISNESGTYTLSFVPAE